MGERYCVCRSRDVSGFMIQCDNCEEWFHAKCLKRKTVELKTLELFYCPPCKETNKKLIERKPKKKPSQKQCGNIQCIEESRPNSKYCSDECAYELNKLRYIKFYVPKQKELEKNRSVAHELRLQNFSMLEKDKQDCEQHIKELRQTNEALLANIEIIKKQAKLEYDEKERLESMMKKDSDEEKSINEEEEVEETLTGDLAKSFCLTCGALVPHDNLLKHFASCHKKLESQFSQTGDVELNFKNYCDYDPEPSLLCLQKDKKAPRFCMNLATACPQHKNWTIGKDEICACPLDIVQELVPNGPYCLEKKKECQNHYHWDRFRLAQINLQRLQAFQRLDCIIDKLGRAPAILGDTNGGCLGVMLHTTTNHDKDTNIEP